MAVTKVPTVVTKLLPGADVYLQGLVIAVEVRFDKTRVTFKGRRERIYPNAQEVLVLTDVSDITPLEVTFLP